MSFQSLHTVPLCVNAIQHTYSDSFLKQNSYWNVSMSLNSLLPHSTCHFPQACVSDSQTIGWIVIFTFMVPRGWILMTLGVLWFFIRLKCEIVQHYACIDMSAVTVRMLMSAFSSKHHCLSTAARKSPSTRNCVFLLVPTVECLSITVQNDACAEFDTKRLFSHSSAESGKFLCAKITFCDIKTGQLWSSIQFTKVWCGKLEAFSAQTLRMDFTVK